MAIDPAEEITLQQAADRLGVHYMTAYRYIRLGILGAHKVGGRWLVDPPDLDRLQRFRVLRIVAVKDAGLDL